MGAAIDESHRAARRSSIHDELPIVDAHGPERFALELVGRQSSIPTAINLRDALSTRGFVLPSLGVNRHLATLSHKSRTPKKSAEAPRRKSETRASKKERRGWRFSREAKFVLS